MRLLYAKHRRGDDIKVTYRQRKRSIGIAATWIASITVVLNVILSSALLAALSPTAAFTEGHPLCVSGGEGRAVGDDYGKPLKPAGLHCPMCIGTEVAGTPAPDAPGLRERTMVAAPRPPAWQPRREAPPPGHDHQPRGPPRLA